MELFYGKDFEGGLCRLDEEESAHCVRVLRHREGDLLDIIDGKGRLYSCRLREASPKKAVAEVISFQDNWGAHPYWLRMAACPTKNNERFEWFVEKAVEMGVDVISPVTGERSERKVYKKDRADRIALSAAKQSLKAVVPFIEEPATVKELIAGEAGPEAEYYEGRKLRMIACCFEDADHPRRSISEVLSAWDGPADYTILIGPEGDFSPSELHAAIDAGFIPVHLGDSRLRTETAALAAVAAVYFHHI